jgi:hypothetical protein
MKRNYDVFQYRDYYNLKLLSNYHWHVIHRCFLPRKIEIYALCLKIHKKLQINDKFLSFTHFTLGIFSHPQLLMGVHLVHRCPLFAEFLSRYFLISETKFFWGSGELRSYVLKSLFIILLFCVRK